MPGEFDPYYRWLAIPPEQQPPNHYRLLGTQPFEQDVEVIRDAAERQMAHVRSYALGQYADLSQRVLNELGAARACLLNPARKAAYDRELRSALEPAGPPEPPPMAVPLAAVDERSASPPPLPRRPVAPARQVKVGDTVRSVLLGDCELVGPVFQGSSATVLKARAEDGRTVAVKALAPEFAAHPGVLERFYQEAAVGMRQEHPNLVEVFEAGEDRGLHYWITEQVDGENLRQHVEQKGRIETRQAVRLVRSVADGLAALHRAGLVHRCVQPANILLLKSGRAKLAEMGLAAYVDEHIEPIHSGLGLESQQYQAPEQIRRETGAGVPSDVYSLGATLYTLLTGRIPFRAASLTELLAAKEAEEYRLPEDVLPELSPALATAIHLAMSADPAGRPDSVAAFAKLLSGDLEMVGRYRLLEETGRGTSGTVYRARSPDGRNVAVKFLAARAAADQRRLARFQREAELSMQISHPHLVQAIEMAAHQGRHYIAMEYVDGDNLAKHVKKSGRLGEPEALRIAVDMAQALDAAHNLGVIHRDVNPANVLLTRKGRAKLADLGLSKQVDDTMNLTMDGTGLGTPEYIAPEQFTGAKDVDRRCDVYGLGVTLYVMLTGKLPFVGKSNVDKLMAKVNNQYRAPEEFNPTITPMTLALVKRSIDADPDTRPATAGEFAMEALDCLNPARNPHAAPDALEEPSQQGAFWHVSLGAGGPQRGRLKATEAQLAERIAAGRIGPDARASRSGTEPMVPLAELGGNAKLFTREPVLLAVPVQRPGFFRRFCSGIRRLFGGG